MRATVKADPIATVLVHYVSGVNVMNNRGVHVRDPCVVEILAASPVAAIKSGAWITESIVNPAIKTDYRTPITGIPDIEAVRKSPVPGGPEKAHLRREDPDAGDPVVALGAVGPVTRFPDIAGTRTKRLGIHGKNRWPDADRDCYADLCGWACA